MTPKKNTIIMSIVFILGILGILIGAVFFTKDYTPHIPKLVADEHGHKIGKHGGIVIGLGPEDKYHLETWFDKNGYVTVFLLDKEEQPLSIDYEQDIIAFYRINNNESKQVALKPQMTTPRDGVDTFTGQISGFDSAVEGTLVFNINIRGNRYRATVPYAVAMPADISTAEERTLFLTPGGIYTQADIEANGKQIPSQKFKGFKAKHDLNPKKGDRICPITLTLANKNCSWIVQGEEYWFCCPPCCSNFIELCKTDPSKVKHAAEYIKE